MIGFSEIQAFIIVLLAGCSAAASLYGVFKMVKELKKPNEERDEHLKRLDRQLEDAVSARDADIIEINRKLARDKQELIDLGRGQRIILKTEMVILEHMDTGNGHTELKKMKSEINDYLLEERERVYD